MTDRAMQGGGRWGRGSVQGNASDFLRLQSSFLSHTPLRLIIPPPPFPSAPQIPPTSMSYRAACKVVAELGLIHGRAHQHQTQVRAQRQKLLKLSEGVCIFQEVGGYSRASSTLGYPDPPPSPPRPSLSSCCPLPLPQLRRLVDDPLLAGTSHVVVDEVRVELRSEVLLELARWRVASTLDGQSTWPLRPMESDLRLLPSSHSGARALPGF